MDRNRQQEWKAARQQVKDEIEFLRSVGYSEAEIQQAADQNCLIELLDEAHKWLDG